MSANGGLRVAVLAVLMGFIAGLTFDTILHLTGCSAEADLVRSERGPDPKTLPGIDMSNPFKAAAKFAMPSCVSISTRAKVSVPSVWGFVQEGETTHLGSGVVFDTEGHIITNHHVVEGAQEIVVELATGQAVMATLVGVDPNSDLAVVKVEAAGLVPAEFGDSDQMDIGDRVIAIGSPFGLTQSVTEGIISARERKNLDTGKGSRARFLQTSAAINPGNSGGALCDLTGRVIGINTAIKSLSGGFEGIGFAIPGNHAKRVVAEIARTRGNWRPAFLGISIRPVSDREAAQLPIADGATGLWVTAVEAGSPAENAGLRINDLIVGFAGKPLTDPADMINSIQYGSPGSTVELEVLRGGERTNVTATLRQRSK